MSATRIVVWTSDNAGGMDNINVEVPPNTLLKASRDVEGGDRIVNGMYAVRTGYTENGRIELDFGDGWTSSNCCRGNRLYLQDDVSANFSVVPQAGYELLCDCVIPRPGNSEPRWFWGNDVERKYRLSWDLARVNRLFVIVENNRVDFAELDAFIFANSALSIAFSQHLWKVEWDEAPPTVYEPVLQTALMTSGIAGVYERLQDVRRTRREEMAAEMLEGQDEREDLYMQAVIDARLFPAECSKGFTQLRKLRGDPKSLEVMSQEQGIGSVHRWLFSIYEAVSDGSAEIAQIWQPESQSSSHSSDFAGEMTREEFKAFLEANVDGDGNRIDPHWEPLTWKDVQTERDYVDWWYNVEVGGSTGLWMVIGANAHENVL